MTFRRIWTAPSILLFGSFATIAAGCYRPSIAQGGFKCATGKTPCPDGFHCVMPNNLCFEGDAGPPAPACDASQPVSICQTEPAAGQTCNPMCQTNCTCGFCGVVSGATKCITAAEGTKDIGVVCDPQAEVACKPGLFCKPECGQSTFGRCYKFCVGNSDCAGLNCGVSETTSGSAGSLTFKLCNLPGQACDPVAKSGCPADPNSVLGCYVDSNGNPFCDCKGTKALGDGCAFAGDCSPGLICENFGANNTCEAICVSGNDCSSSSSCNPTNGSYGYCL